MITINNYIKPNSIKEAYEILMNTSNSQVIGGGIFIGLSSKDIDVAIDLYELDMNYIKENEEYIEIGAMTTFREIETSEILKKHFGDIFSNSLKDIVGVQLKNAVTLGGSIYPKYGFSDLLTALLVLECSVVLYGAGEIKLEDFLNEELGKEDILTKIIIKKQNAKTAFKCLRNSTGDYSILNVAVSHIEGKFKIAIGSRPAYSVKTVNAQELLNNSIDIDEEIASKAGEIASEETVFGSNYLATAEYRKDICKVLIKRAIMEVII